MSYIWRKDGADEAVRGCGGWEAGVEAVIALKMLQGDSAMRATGAREATTTQRFDSHLELRRTPVNVYAATKTLIGLHWKPANEYATHILAPRAAVYATRISN